MYRTSSHIKISVVFCRVLTCGTMETTDNSDTDDEFDLDELIKQLEDLRTQEQVIINKIKRRSHNNPASRLNLVAEISNTTRHDRRDRVRDKKPEFSPGDRVRIKNKVTPLGVTESTYDRIATVTETKVNRLGQRQVYIITDNKVKTYRSEKNLERF